MTLSPWLIRLSTLSIVLAFSVILLGAYTRLQDAGLGCPDWPGCYGQLSAPSNESEINAANLAYPTSPVDVSKAKTEMTHRYFAESLGALIFIFAGLALWQRKKTLHGSDNPHPPYGHPLPEGEGILPLWLPITLVVLVLFQGLLGMWTVTLQLWPIIVVAHLLGGFCTLGLLWLASLHLRQRPLPTIPLPSPLLSLSLFTLMVLVGQIFLGGWTSSNYAALICPDFPTCQGHWWPNSNFSGAFDWFATMDTPQRTAVHLSHRLGALFTFLLIGGLVHYILHINKRLSDEIAKKTLRRYCRWITLLLIIQVALGISNVVLFLPLPIAVAHNGVAALLFLALVTLNFTLYKMSRGHHG